MAQKNSALRNIWEAASQEYDLGNYDQFATSMEDPQARKNLYDALQADYELGTLEDFDSTMTNELNELSKHYIDSLWSDATNNNYDLSTPRDFKNKMKDEAYRQKFYESYTADGHNLGGYEEFNNKVANALKANEPKTWIGRKAENLWNATKSGLMTVGNQAMDFGNLAIGLDINTPALSTKAIDTANEMQKIMNTPLSERRAAQERVAKGEGTEWDKEMSGSLDVADKATEQQQAVAQDARRDIGEDDNFVDLIKHGNIGGAIELGMITALESAPQMLLGHNAVGRVMLGTLSASDEYDRLTKERPNMSEGARVAQAVFHGAIEQLWERWGNPLKLGKAKAAVGSNITRQIREWATKEWKQKLKTAGKGVLDWLREATDEGMEEVMTDLCNNIFDTLLGAADENAEGLVNEYKEAAAAAAENGEELTIQQFAFDKAKETLNSFIGGAAAGGIMGAGSAMVNQSVAHHAKYQVREEDGTTRRMTKEERKKLRQTADLAMRAIDKIAQEDGISRTDVLDRIDEEEQDRQEMQDIQVQEALNDWAEFIPNEQSQEDVIGDYTKRYNEILAQEAAELRRGVEGNTESTTETTTQEEAATEQEAAEAEHYRYRDPNSKKAYEFVRNADGTFYMLKDGKPVTTHTWTTDEFAEKGWKYLSDKKNIRQQSITINLNGQPEPVRFSCSNAVFNEDGSLNMEEIDSKRLFIFPNGSQKYGNGRFPKEERDNVIAALQEALKKEKADKDAKEQEAAAQEAQQGAHRGKRIDTPAYVPKTDPANALTAEQQAAAEAERIKAEAERRRIEKLRKNAKYPTKEDGSPDYENMTPEQQADYTNEKYGAEAVGELVKNAIAELNANLEGIAKKKGLTPVERMDATMAIRQQIAAWEEAGEKYAEKSPENLDNSEKSVIFAQAKDGKPTRMSFNLTQNAGEDTAEGASQRLDEKNEADRVAYKEALNTLRNEEATEEERTAAEEAINQIEAKRKEQMTQLAQEALKGIEGVRLVGVEEGTGVYLGDNGEVIEYTSVVEVEVEEGHEAAAIAAMAAVAETTKQDSYIVNYPTEENTVYGVPESYSEEWQQPSPAAQVVVPLNKPLTQTQKAILTKAFIDAGLGVTITDKEISTSNFTFETDEEFYKVADNILKTFNDGNAKTEIQDGSGLQGTEGESVVQGEGGSGLDIQLLGAPVHRKNYSHYNEATKNGNDRDYTTVARTDANWQHAGDQSIYEQEEGSSSLRVPQTAISREDLLQRLQNVYTQTEEAMPSPASLVPQNDGPDTPLGGGEGGNPPAGEWKPDEVVDLQDDDVVVLLHHTREHYPLVKIARVTEEDGKRVYHEIGQEGKIIDAEAGNWHEMKGKNIVEDENGVEYLFIDFDGRSKRRGIPVLATNGQLEAINQQNRPKATGLKGLTELKKAPLSKGAADEEVSSMQAAIEKPLIKASGTKLTLSLLDILSLRPYATEVTEMAKDKEGNDVPKTSIKVVSIWQQIAALCDKMARESQATTNEKYGKQADELQIAEQANALLQDFKRAYKKRLDAWNKLVRKNKIDQLIAEHIDQIDPELIEAYRALHEKMYHSAKEGNPSAMVQTNFDGSRYKNIDENIFRYMQVVFDITRQACNASNITDVEDVLDMAVLKETPWRETSQDIRKKAGGKTTEDIKKEILNSLDPENVHSAEDILQIKQRVGNMRKLLEDKEFEQDFLEAVQIAEEIYGRTDDIDNSSEGAKEKKKGKEKDKGDEIKTLQLALAAAQKKGDTERAQKIENRLKELQSEEAAAADAEAEGENDTTPKPKEDAPETPEDRQKRYDQLRAQQDYFWGQKKKAHAEGDADAEAQADAMVKRIDEELDKMDEEAEMQQGQSVMPNATPAQRFVTNVVLKALKHIKGITIHHATQADVERIMAQMKAKKAEQQGNKKPSWKDTIISLETISHTLMSTDTRSNSNSESDAKVQYNSDITKSLAELSSTLDNGETYSVKELVGQIAMALGIQSANSKYSNYKTITLSDGTKINIRVSTHQANAFNFELKRNNKSVNVGFVIKDGPSMFKAHSDVNYVEFVYYGDKTTDTARQKAIVEGIRHLVETGSFDGIAEADKVNLSGEFRNKAEAQIIGENGAEALDRAEEAATRMDNLQVARDMESAGKDAMAIRLATGWERGADGKWRYEIPDIRLADEFVANYGYYTNKTRNPDKTYRLSDVLDSKSYERIATVYPSVKNIKIIARKLEEYTGGYFDAPNQTLYINAKYGTDYLMGIISHELQHCIQDIEGFANGGDMSMFEDHPEIKKLRERIEEYNNKVDEDPQVKDAQKRIKDLEDRGNYGSFVFTEKGIERENRLDQLDVIWNNLIDTGAATKEARLQMEDKQNEIMGEYHENETVRVPTQEERIAYKKAKDEYYAVKKAVKKQYQQEIQDIKDEIIEKQYELYKSLGGEVESRNVQSRLRLTPEQRRSTLLRETEDVARENQIFLYNNITTNRTGSHSESEIEPLTTSDGTVYGWSVGNEIWLTDEGLNPETPIHEYLHLFVKAMAQENSKEWQRIVKLCKANTTLWNEVANDPNYKHLQDIEDEAQRDSAIASEMLARYGGKRGAEQLNEKATQMEKEGHSFESDAAAKLLVGRMKKALQEVYQWALDKLGIPRHYKSIDEVVDKGLYDLLSESRIDIADFTVEEQNIVDRAKADGTYMKAPNGQPTNLTPKQWAQTRTEAFKKWFGDWEKDPSNASKCVDENGEPKVVYRGSKNANSYVFHTRYENAGYWFSDNKSVAEHYARRGADHELSQEELDERVQPCFLNVRSSEQVDAGGRTWQNVYEQPKYAIYDDETGHIKAEFDTRAEAEQYCKENGLDPYVEIEENNGISGDIAESRIANGLDGMEFQNMIDGNAKDHTDVPSNVWVVKDNTQAKSAEENSGEFDSTNPDIRFQVGRTKAEIEAQIESGDISKVDLAAEMYVKEESNFYKTRKYDPSVPMPEQLSFLQGLRNSAIDEGYGLHLLRQRMDAIRKAQGKKAYNRDKYDIRALKEQAEAATAGKQKLLNDRQLHDLALVLYGKGRKNKGLIGAIEKSALLKKYKTETLIDQNGNQQTVRLSAQDLLNRYLIARDNIERIERGIPPRGLAEFTQRMGVDMVDFMREFQDAFGTEPLAELHRRIKAVTDVSLDALHDAGMLTDEQYEIYKSRQFYVPEKGYEDQRQQLALVEYTKDIWEKVKGVLVKAFATDGHIGAKTDGAKRGVKPMATSYRARGGDSLGTDIIEHIVQDTYDAIAKAEQNNVKRAMYDMLREDPEVTRAMRLPVPEEVHYVMNEKGEWVRKTDGITKEERAEAAAIDEQIRILESEAATTTDEETLNDIYREIDGLLAMRPFADEYITRNVWQSEQEVRQESVGVWVNGVLQEMRFPNMVQVANALNGRRNTEKAIAAAREVNGWIASICTNFNPTFFATNIVRDVPFIMKKGSSEYGFEFAGYFTKNLADPRIQKSIWSYIAGNLDETDGGRFSSDFYDFVTGGGQTGYARTPEIDELRKKLNKWQNTGFGLREMLDAGPKLNEWSEWKTHFLLTPSANY